MGTGSTMATSLAPVCLLAALAGCARTTMPDPKEPVRAYEQAAARGDAKAIYGMLSARSRQSLRVPDVERLLADERSELSSLAKAVGDPSAAVRATARVRYADGELATLDLEGDGFRVSSADALPAAARTPTE